MKQNKKDVILMTLGIVVAITGSLLFFMWLDKGKQESGVEAATIDRQVSKQTIAAVTPQEQDTSSSLAPSPTAAQSTTMPNATPRVSNASNSTNYQVVLQGTKVEKAAISMEKAAEIAVKNIKFDSNTGQDQCTVYMSSIKNSGIADGAASWSANVEIANAFRYEFVINSATGAVTSKEEFMKENSSSNRWTKIQADVVGPQEYRVEKRNLGNKNDIKEIEVNINAAVDCEIISGGTEFAVSMHYYSRPEYNISYEIKNQQLYIEDNSTYQIEDNQFRDKLIGKANIITITVPKGASLRNINMSTSLGDFRLSSIRTTKIKLHTNNGDITVRGCSYKEMTADTINGDIYLAGALEGKTSGNTTNGDITAKCINPATDYNYYLETTLGDVTAEGKTSETSLEKKSGKNHLQLQTTNGDIKLDFK